MTVSTRGSNRWHNSSMGHNTEKKQKYDFNWALEMNRLSLNLMGIWPRKHLHNDTYLRQVRAPFMIFWMMLSIFVPQMYALSQISFKVSLVTDNLMSSIAMLISSIKIFFIWNNRYQLRPVLDIVRKDWSEARWLSWQLDVMVKQAGRARIITIGGYVVMLLSVGSFMTTPFLGISVRIINNITDPYGTKRFFPLQTAYPFDAFSSPFFEFIYFTQIVGCAFAGVCFSVPDSFFGALAFHASAQCELLADKFKTLFPKDSGLVEKWILDGERAFQSQLKQSVQRHIHLISFTASIENLFNLLVLSHVVCLYIILCSLGFGIVMQLRSHTEKTSFIQVATFGGTILNLSTHMLVYCFTSEVLVYHSSELHEAIYGSGWYLLPAKYSRNIIPLLMRAKVPLQLTAGKFFNLSLSAYCTIIKTTASYMSVLMATTN